MAKSEKIDFLWRYQPLKNTADGALLAYLKHNGILPVREMILQSLRAYWLPLAYQHKGEMNPVVLERMFKKAVYALEKHALYLCDQVGIDYASGLYLRNTFPTRESLFEQDFNPEKGIVTNFESRLIQNDSLTTEQLLNLVGCDEFDDSGFSSS